MSIGGELSEKLGPVGTLISAGAESIGGKVGPIGTLRSTGGGEGVMGPPLPTTSLQS
jgi:hypothetical protein